MIFIHGHLYHCWFLPLAMYPSIDIHNWSYNPLLIFLLGHVSPWKYSYLFRYVDTITWSCIHMLIFTCGHVSPCSYSYLDICHHVDFQSCSCIPMFIFTCGYVSLCWYFHFVMCHHVNINTGSSIALLLFTIGIVNTVDILSWSHVPVLAFTLGHGSPPWYSHLLLCHYVDIHIWGVSQCWTAYWYLVMVICLHVW